MESTINTLIPFAIDAIDKNEKIRNNQDANKVEGIYESYLSQFGPMVIQLGLRSTLAVYQNKKGGSKGDRGYILDLLWKVLGNSPFSTLIPHIVNNRNKWIDNYLRQTDEIDNQEETLILDASIALKRAIRTFSLTEDKSE